MKFQQINREDGDKVFIIARNTSGATLSAGAAAFFDRTTVDGNAVSGAGTGNAALFAGVAAAAITNSSYGLVQVYGVASAYYCPGSSAVSAVIGNQLVAVTSQTYLSKDPGTTVIGSSAAYSIPTQYPFVTLYEDVASAAALSNTPALKKVFVRAL